MLGAIADFLNAKRVGNRAWWNGVAGLGIWIVTGAVLAALLAQLGE